VSEERLRIDVWLWRARFAKTRSAAARLVEEGAVRLIRENAARRLDKAASFVSPGDALVFPRNGALKAVRILAFGTRRGPPAEARALYEDLPAEPNPDLAGLA
jgi:ribosome-associated heat shock protein Hsp15